MPRSVNKLRPPLPQFPGGAAQGGSVMAAGASTATSPYGTMRRNYSSTQSLVVRAVSKIVSLGLRFASWLIILFCCGKICVVHFSVQSGWGTIIIIITIIINYLYR